jgi:hypothetical protein
MGACHYPFVSISCSPEQATVVPGGVLELTLSAENQLADASVPMVVDVVALLPNGGEYPLMGPIPRSGIAIPAGSVLEGTIPFNVPAGIPNGFQCEIRACLTEYGTGSWVHEDSMALTVSTEY